MTVNINKVHFAGCLVRDPDLRHTPSGTPVCNVTLAQNSRVKDPQSGRWVDGDPIFVDFAIWGKRGEAFEKYHKKGDLTYIEGKLRFDTWDDRRTGDKRSKLKVDADHWEFLPFSERTVMDNTPF